MAKAPQGQIVEFGTHLIHQAEWIADPVSVSWFPQTLFWKLIGVGILSVIFAWAIYRCHQYVARTYLREAWALFNQHNANNHLALIAELMKRLAHQHWPLAQVGTMNNTELAQFIAAHGNQTITEPQVLALINAGYSPNPRVDTTTQQAIQAWFKEITC